MMTDVFRSLGRSDALKLRSEAANLTGTEIIAREVSVPPFDPKRDYTDWPAGSPVADEGQVWLLLQPHNASHYEGRPAQLRMLWGLAHTKDPARAKAWVPSYGISGLYMLDECYRDAAGVVWRSLRDNQDHDAAAYPQGWQRVENV